MSSFTISLSAYDSRNRRHLFFKADGQRFGDARTIKLSCDVKYDLTVSIKPAVARLQKVVMGGDELTLDSSQEREGRMEYKCSWLTNGYQPTRKGARNDMRICFKFDSGELILPLQCKFYSQTDSTHLTWGTPLKSIEVESTGNFAEGGSAGPYQTFPPKAIAFK